MQNLTQTGPITILVNDGSFNLPPNGLGASSGWAQTQPGHLTHRQPYVLVSESDQQLSCWLRLLTLTSQVFHTQSFMMIPFFQFDFAFKLSTWLKMKFLILIMSHYMAKTILVGLNLCTTFLKVANYCCMSPRSWRNLSRVPLKVMINSWFVLLTRTITTIKSLIDYTTPLSVPSLLYLATIRMLSLPDICWPNAILHLMVLGRISLWLNCTISRKKSPVIDELPRVLLQQGIDKLCLFKFWLFKFYMKMIFISFYLHFFFRKVFTCPLIFGKKGSII